MQAGAGKREVFDACVFEDENNPDIDKIEINF